MRRAKKGLVAALLAAVAGCFAFTALILPKNDYTAKNSSESVTVAPEAQFSVMGGSVRLNADRPGVRFHVTMPKSTFEQIGSLDENGIGTLDEGYKTGTLLVPEYVAPAEVVVGAERVSNTDTTNLWYTKAGWDYVQSVVYLYNIPTTEFGTPIYVRGYIQQPNGDYVYTEQVNSISMSYVALAEYNDANTKLDETQLADMKELYIDKTVNVHIGGEVSTIDTSYGETLARQTAAARAKDNDEFLGFFDQYGDAYDFKKPVKNNTNVYAYYRESIVLKSAAADFAGPSFPIGHYKRNAGDTVVGNTITFKAADGSTYALTYDPATEGLSGLDALTAETKDHGEGTVTVILNSVTGKNYTLTLPALVITREITKLAEISYSVRTWGWESDTSGIPNVSGVPNGIVESTENILEINNYASTADAALYGYYRLGNDLGNWISGGKFQYGLLKQLGLLAGGGYNKPDQGFRGTFDGAGYSIMVAFNAARGMFGQIGNGAVIKDVNIDTYSTPQAHIPLFGAGIFGATIENIRITTKGGMSDTTSHVRAFGLLTSAGASGTTFRNVVIDLPGKTVSSLFGGHYSGNGYESVETVNGKQNVYENFKVYANSIGSIGYNLHSDYLNTDVVALGVVVTLEDEIAAGNDITYAAAAANESATVAGRQTIVLTDPSTWELNLGKYANLGTITSIKRGNHSLGTDLTYLTIPDALKADTQNHGEQNVTVVINKLDGKTLTVTVPVLLVTKEIHNTAEFEAVFNYTDGATRYYGYYRLANNIGNANWKFNASVRGGSNNEWWTNGFVGTFDGNGYTITGISADGGLFGRLADKSVVKNVTIHDVSYSGTENVSVLGYTVAGSTLENVTFKFSPVGSGAKTPTIPTANQYCKGWLANQACYGTKFTNCTVDIAGYSMYSLFGSGWYHGYEARATNGDQQDKPNTYNNFVINAAELKYIGYRYEDSTSGNVLGTFYAFSPEDEKASGEDIIYNKTQMDYGTVTLERTDIVLSGVNARNTLAVGEYADWTATGITEGFSYANGKLTVSDALKANLQKHGEQTVEIALVSEIGQTVNIIAPITLVTKEITTEEEWADLFSYEPYDMNGDGTLATNEGGLFGYYTLGDDLGWSGGSMWTYQATAKDSNGADLNFEHRMNGFRGTFDGRGYKITGRHVGKGLFGWIGDGAVIKNFDVLDVYWTGGTYNSLFAVTIACATIENVNVTFQPYGAAARVPSDAQAFTGTATRRGWLAYQWCYGTTFRNVTLTANKDASGNAADYSIGSLFGAASYGCYEWTNANGDMQNTYDGLYINVTTLHALGIKYNTANGTYAGISIEDEIGDDDGQTDVIFFNGEKIGEKLDENPAYAQRDIILSSSNAANKNVVNGDGSVTVAMDLGEYAEYVSGITLKLANGSNVELAVNTADETYTIPADLAANLQAHGAGSLTVNVNKEDSKQNFSFAIPVILVTKEIMTKEEFASTIDYNNTNKTLYGYYTLGADIGSNNMGGGQPWRFGATAAADNYGGRGLPQPEAATYGFRGTFDGRSFTITGRSYAGGLFGLLGRNALVKDVTIVDVYANGCQQAQSVLAGFAREATVENVTFKYSHATWANAQYKPTNPGGQRYNTGWIVSTMAAGMTFINCTVDAAEYDFYSLFGSGWYAGYEHTTTNKTPGRQDNTYNNFQINVKSLSYLGYYYIGSTAWNQLGTFYGITPEQEVNDDDGMNDIIYLNGEKIAVQIDEIDTYAAQDIVLNGANKTVQSVDGSGNATVAMSFGTYTQYVDSAVLTDAKGAEYDVNYNSANGTFTLPAAVYNDLDKHGVGKMRVNVVKADSNQEFNFELPITVVTLEITTAAEISTFLREYASVAKDEVFKGYTEANQAIIPTLQWEGTNEYSGYFTLGANVNFANYKGAAGVTIGGVTYTGYNPYNVYTYGGQYWNPFGQNQTADDDSTLKTATANGGYYYYPMGIDADPGNENKGFRGTFDGRGYEIQNFRAAGYACAKSNGVTGDTAYSKTGFISKLTATGVIKNVRFTNADMYLGALISSWGGGTIEGIQVKLKQAVVAASASYIIGPYGYSGKTNDVLDQFNLFKNSIVDLSAYTGIVPVVAFSNKTYKNIENVYFIGSNTYTGPIVGYFDSMYTSKLDKDDTNLYTRQPMGLDSFQYYDNLNTFVTERADIVNGWGNYLSIADGNVQFGNTLVMDGQVGSVSNTDSLVRADGQSDYVIVYEDGNQKAMEAAAYIAEHVRRATGTVTYTEYTATAGGASTAFVKEHLDGGIVVPTMTDAVWDENANYIVIGNVDGMPELDGPTNSYKIQAYGKSVFISVSDDIHYLAAAIRFLEKAIGYQGLNDSYVRYVIDATGVTTYATFEGAIDEEVAFQRRATTNANYESRLNYKGINDRLNGMPYFSYGPAYVDAKGNDQMHGIHNSMYWLPNGQGIYTLDSATLPTGYSSNSNWYSTTTRDNGTYTGYDLCYIARGNSTAYNSMVEYTAQHMLNVLDAVDPDDTWEVPLSFGCMDDVTMYYDCNCGATNKYNVKHNGSQNVATREIIDFLNAVTAKVSANRTNYSIYLLGYYYAEDPANVTSLDSHIGVIYAPISSTETSKGGSGAVETKSIYDDVNKEVRARIQEWTALTDKMAFWFYDTRFKNFFMPLDTFSSMITWLEFAARTCRDDNVAWVTVNGQSSNYNPSVFEDFKSYTVQMAEIEVLQKITYDPNPSAYEQQLNAYMLELEQEFFGFSGNGTAVEQFVDGGYYGPAAANHAMYQYYKEMRSDYQSKVGKKNAYEGKTWYGGTSLIKMEGTCSEYYDYVKYGSSAGSDSSSARFADYLSGSGKYMYFANFTKAEINDYMNYLEAAILAVNEWDDPAKNVCYRNVLQESLFPRFVICMSNSSNSTYGFAGGYSHGAEENWSGSLAEARTEFYNDCVTLGWLKYSEHHSIGLIFDKWVKDGTSWSRPANGIL